MLKNKIKTLIKLIEDTEIEEIEVSSFWGIQKIKLSKSNKNNNTSTSNQTDGNNKNTISTSTQSIESNDGLSLEEKTQISSIDNQEEQLKELNYEDDTKFKIITAPLVGTFYLSPKPEDPAFVNIGDRIKIGTTLCIIEAMKIFNDIDSEFSGELIEVYVKNGNPVEYGQELFVLRIDR